MDGGRSRAPGAEQVIGRARLPAGETDVGALRDRAVRLERAAHGHEAGLQPGFAVDVLQPHREHLQGSRQGGGEPAERGCVLHATRRTQLVDDGPGDLVAVGVPQDPGPVGGVQVTDVDHAGRLVGDAVVVRRGQAAVQRAHGGEVVETEVAGDRVRLVQQHDPALALAGVVVDHLPEPGAQLLLGDALLVGHENAEECLVLPVVGARDPKPVHLDGVVVGQLDAVVGHLLPGAGRVVVAADRGHRDVTADLRLRLDVGRFGHGAVGADVAGDGAQRDRVGAERGGQRLVQGRAHVDADEAALRVCLGDHQTFAGRGRRSAPRRASAEVKLRVAASS